MILERLSGLKDTVVDAISVAMVIGNISREAREAERNLNFETSGKSDMSPDDIERAICKSETRADKDIASALAKLPRERRMAVFAIAAAKGKFAEQKLTIQAAKPEAQTCNLHMRALERLKSETERLTSSHNPK